MSISFNPEERLVLTTGNLWGPNGLSVIRLVVDTGATYTVISREAAETVGYDLTEHGETLTIATGSRLEILPVFRIDRLVALDRELRNMDVLCHTVPGGLDVDGLLGLDFFRGRRLTIDFREGSISLD